MKFFLFFLFIFLKVVSVYGITPADTLKTNKNSAILDTGKKDVQKAAKDTSKPANDQNEASGKGVQNTDKCNCIPHYNDNWNSTAGSWLVFLPVVVFVIFIMSIMIGLRHFELKEALSENIIEKVTKTNKQYDADKIAAIIKDASGNATVISNLPTIFPPTIDISDINENTNEENHGSTDASTNDVKDVSAKFDEAATTAIAALEAIKTAIEKASKPEATEVDMAALNYATQNADVFENAITASSALRDVMTTVNSKAIVNGDNNKKTYRPSSSRVIAFITSMFTLVISVSMCCFFIYHYMYTGCPPDMSAMTTMLITLGIGVTPYAFNKIAGAISANKDSSK